jgi:hypothetical protein
MDRSGDARHCFNPRNRREIQDAQARFDTLVRRGFRPVALEERGRPARLLREFDATVERTLFVPQLIGG